VGRRDEHQLRQPATKVVELFKRSLLVVRTQIDNNGAICAANDSDIMQFSRDTYSLRVAARRRARRRLARPRRLPRRRAVVLHLLPEGDHRRGVSLSQVQP
jgi:hypothetical protein